MKKYIPLFLLVFLVLGCNFSVTAVSTPTNDASNVDVIASTDTAQPKPEEIATNTPQPTLTPFPSPTIQLVIMYEEDCSNNMSGCELGQYNIGSLGYTSDGEYLAIAYGQSYVWGVASQYFYDFTLDVDVTQVQAPGNNNNVYGVIVRSGNWNELEGYWFAISGDGYAGIFLFQNNSMDVVADWPSSGIVNTGNASNHLTITCDGSYLEFAVNGQVIGSATDSTFSSGDIAFMAASLESEVTEVHFDNLVISEPR